VDKRANAGFLRRLGDRSCSEGLYGVETLPAPFAQNANEIDHRVGASNRRRHGRRITQIGLHGVNLTDPADGLQVKGKIGAADGDADSPTLPGERPDNMSANETRTAEDRHQPIPISWNFRHIHLVPHDH
jgi:hypothetical protein